MKFPSPTPVQWIANLIGADIKGNTDGVATGINEIHRVEYGDVVFVDHPKYYNTCIESSATVIIINQETTIPENKTLLIVENPFEAYLKIVNHFMPFERATQSISSSSTIGNQTYIAPNAFVGNHVVIGENCIIQPNVSIMDHSIIGNNVVIQSGTVIGSDAFYYNTKKNRENWYKRMDSCGAVIIEDDVEIGANCTIDRGVTHNTLIGKGTKIDNLVQLGHDVVIGKNCLIASQVGIAGATTLEDGVILWGQVGVNKTIRIGKGAIVMGQSGVFNNLEGGKVYMGFPAEEAGKKRRELIWIRRIPEIWEKLSDSKK
jgi:UDP-3-O-[3-hydroxymyristoyl] glucosamine N-acyltransferase